MPSLSHTELHQSNPDRKHLVLQPSLIHYKESVIFASSQLVLGRYIYFIGFFFIIVKEIKKYYLKIPLDICQPPPTFNTLSLSQLSLTLSLLPGPPTCCVPASNRGRDSPALLMTSSSTKRPAPNSSGGSLLYQRPSRLREVQVGYSHSKMPHHLYLFQHFPYLLVLHPPCCFALATNWSRDYPLYWRSSRLGKLQVGFLSAKHPHSSNTSAFSDLDPSVCLSPNSKRGGDSSAIRDQKNPVYTDQKTREETEAKKIEVNNWRK